MRGLSPDRIPELVAADVARVERHAAHVVYLNGGVKVLDNPSPRINVIAVVGPGQAFGQNFEQAVLLEVGIFRARPWQEVEGIPRRRSWCSLNPEQYLEVAPALFGVLQSMTNQRVRMWRRKAESPVYLTMRQAYFYRYLRAKSRRFSMKKGCRFSVSRRDIPLLADLYWATLYGLESRKIIGFGRYAETLLVMSRGKKNRAEAIEDLTLEVQDRLNRGHGEGSWPRCQLWAARKYGRKTRRYGIRILEHFLRGQLDWQGEEMPEEVLASRVLHGVKKRVAKIHIRDISGTRQTDAQKPYVVFEMLPS